MNHGQDSDAASTYPPSTSTASTPQRSHARSGSTSAKSDVTRYSLSTISSWKGKARASDAMDDAGDAVHGADSPRPPLRLQTSSSLSEFTTPSTLARPSNEYNEPFMNTPDGHPPGHTTFDGNDGEMLTDARRYEEFDTVDWIQDTLFERARRLRETRAAVKKANRLARQASYSSSRFRLAGLSSDQVKHWLETLLYATQSWLVFALVGAGIGVNAALIDVATGWLTDIKFGYCRYSWWLNSKFCCWEIDPVGSPDDGSSGSEYCEDWHSWSDSFFGMGFLVYTFYAVLFAFSAAFIVRKWAPYAAGSGISEIKCILAGFIMKGFLSATTLLIKSITLPLVIASGLSVGKEGPTVHIASAIGSVVGSSFKRFSRSQAKMREVITAASAAGVAVAFGSPIGGVLFALEEMTVNFPIKTMWRSFFCALVATVTLSAMNPFRTGKLVLFQVSYDRDWHFFEIGGFILIGIFGGLYGAFVIKYNFQVQSFRRKHLASNGVAEAVVLAALTAFVGYHNRFLRIDMTESLDILFRECEGGGDHDNLCQTWAQWRMVNSLLLATIIRVAFIIISYGAKVPAGIFVPSMAVGASFGRMVGILVKATYRANPHWAIFAACDPEVPCITPGTYAFLGAAAALGGIMRITVTVVVIMFELTGALTYILPTMIVLMVTKAVSEMFGKGGIADQAIRFNGFPFLDKEDHHFNEPVSRVMKRNILAIPATGLHLHELESRFVSSAFRGFPVVQSKSDHTLLGYITRSDLRWAVDKARRSSGRIPRNAKCVFRKTAEGNDQSFADDADDTYQDVGLESLNFAPWVNETILTVSPNQALEIVMQLFKKMGPRVILVEHRGQLRGLITIKDILKEIIAHEQVEHPEGGLLDAELEESLEEAQEWVKEKANIIADKLGLKRSKHGANGIVLPLSAGIPLEDRHGADDSDSTIIFDAAAAERSKRQERLGNPFQMNGG